MIQQLHSGKISKETQNTNGNNISTSMFIAVLFTIAKIRKQPKCPLVDEWIKKAMVHLHNGMLLSNTKEGNFTFCNIMSRPGEYYAK